MIGPFLGWKKYELVSVCRCGSRELWKVNIKMEEENLKGNYRNALWVLQF